MPRTGIALGSNLGDRLNHLRQAADMLRALAVVGEPFIHAPVYQTEPRFCPPGSPSFLNTVIEINFLGTPDELLTHTRAIEQFLGRTPTTQRNAPRVIDVDILYLGSSVVSNDSLTLPHPRITERRFVLQPLADIRPELILPGQQQSIIELLENLQSDEPPLQRLD